MRSLPAGLVLLALSLCGCADPGKKGGDPPDAKVDDPKGGAPKGKGKDALDPPGTLVYKLPLPLPTPADKLPKGCWIEDRPDPKLPEEKLVADFIRKHVQSVSSRPKTLRFHRWGPHDLKDRWVSRLNSYPGRERKAVRVVWSIKQSDGRVSVYDTVQSIRNGR